MRPLLDLLATVSWQPLLAALVSFCSLLSTLIVTRTNRWLRELLERERLASEKQLADMHERELLRSNATLRTLSESSANAERVTLESLLSNELRDFTLESSPTPYDLSDEVTALRHPSSYPPPEHRGSKP